METYWRADESTSRMIAIAEEFDYSIPSRGPTSRCEDIFNTLFPKGKMEGFQKKGFWYFSTTCPTEKVNTGDYGLDGQLNIMRITPGEYHKAFEQVED